MVGVHLCQLNKWGPLISHNSNGKNYGPKHVGSVRKIQTHNAPVNGFKNKNVWFFFFGKQKLERVKDR